MPADEDAVELALGHRREMGSTLPELKISPARRGPRSRKPSLLAGLIIWSTSLPVAAVISYAVLLWAFGADPIGLGPKLPAFLVPAALRNPPGHGTQIAQVPKNNDAELQGFNTNVPAAQLLKTRRFSTGPGIAAGQGQSAG